MISVIIPAYNAAAYIEECIHSVLKQTWTEYEVIVVDDASEDATPAIVQEMMRHYANIRLIQHEHNRGELLARKTGTEQARGAYCIYLDQDDTLRKDALELVQGIFDDGTYDILSFGIHVCPEATVDAVHLEAVYSYFVPYEGSLKGEEIFEKCYIDRAYSHNVWDKAYRTDLCKEGFSYITEDDIAIGADTYTYFVFSYLAESFLGIKDEIYEYHAGRGLTGQKAIGVDKFEMHCKQANMVVACERFLQKQHTLSKYGGVIQRLDDDAVMECVNCFMRNIRQEDAEKAMILLKAYWGETKTCQTISLWGKQANEAKEHQLLQIAEIENLQRYVQELKSIMDRKRWQFPFQLVPRDARIVIYGAGQAGQDFVRQLQAVHWGKLVLWVDNGKSGEVVEEIRLSDSSKIHEMDFEFIVIAISDPHIQSEIRQELMECGIAESKIIEMDDGLEHYGKRE